MCLKLDVVGLTGTIVPVHSDGTDAQKTDCRLLDVPALAEISGFIGWPRMDSLR